MRECRQRLEVFIRGLQLGRKDESALFSKSVQIHKLFKSPLAMGSQGVDGVVWDET